MINRITILLLCCLVSACGSKGDLYLPKAENNQEKADDKALSRQLDLNKYEPENKALSFNLDSAVEIREIAPAHGAYSTLPTISTKDSRFNKEKSRP